MRSILSQVPGFLLTPSLAVVVGQLVSLISLAVGLKHMVGDASKQWKDAYIAILLLIMVAIEVRCPIGFSKIISWPYPPHPLWQYYYLLFAAIMVPPGYTVGHFLSLHSRPWWRMAS
jgi:hypothetical protein